MDKSLMAHTIDTRMSTS